MSAMMTRSEDVLGEKWDRCLSDTLIKMGAGFGVGIVFSLLLKRRMWPLVFGMGTGLGMGIANCQHDFNYLHHNTQRIKKLKVKEPEANKPTIPEEK